MRSLREWLRSASFMVGSSSIRTSPIFTLCPSRTWIARTTPVSNGWTVLVRPLGMIFPCADATISIVPNAAQTSARQKTAMMVTPMARPIGEGGVSTTSSAAGRNASSSRSRRSRPFGNGMTPLANFMDAALHAVERRVPAAGPDQLVMRAVLDEPAALDRHDAVAPSHRRQPVRDDEHRAAFGDLLHVLLDDPFALVVERARGFVEDQDPRIAEQCASDGDALALSARETGASLAHDGVIAFGKLQDEVVRARLRRRGDDALHRHGRVGERDIVAHRAIEQHVLLQHDTD